MDVLELSAKVAGGAVGATLTAHGVPGTGPAVEALLTSLLGIQAEQAAAVERIDAAVQRLVDGPWRTAGLLIEEARLPDRTVKEVRRYLQEAASKLRDAIPLQEEASFGRAYVCLDLSIVLYLLGDASGAALYARQAVIASEGYVKGVRLKRNMPPDYRKVATKVTLNASSSLIQPIGIMLLFSRKPPLEVSRFDAALNAWLQDVIRESKMVRQAATNFISRTDAALIPAEDTHDLIFRWGRLTTKASG